MLKNERRLFIFFKLIIYILKKIKIKKDGGE